MHEEVKFATNSISSNRNGPVLLSTQTVTADDFLRQTERKRKWRMGGSM